MLVVGGSARVMLVQMYVKYVRKVVIKLYDIGGNLIDSEAVGYMRFLSKNISL